jgi:hypothetical protein
MIGRLFLLLLLLVLIVPVSSFSEGSTAPLTLLKKPDTTAQPAPGQQNQAVSNSDKELRDIYGPVPTTERPPYLFIAGIILFVLLAAAAITWFLKKRTTPAPPPVPPWEKALLELADARKWLSPERALAYMDRVSQILRTYIESRFAIQSTRQTTREFLQNLTTVGTASPLQAHKSALQACLEQADMAKFAHHVPEIENLEKMEEAVTTFIKRTEPAESAKESRPQKQVQQSLLKKGGRS